MDVMTLKTSNIEAPRMFQTAVQDSFPISPSTSGKSIFLFPTNSASQVNTYGLSSSNHNRASLNSNDMYISASEEETVKDDSNIEAPRMFQTAVQDSFPISPSTSGKSIFLFPTNSASQVNTYGLSSSNHNRASLNNNDMYISASEEETVKDEKNINKNMYISATEDDTFNGEKNMSKESLSLSDGEEIYHRLVKEAVDQLDEHTLAKKSSLANSIPTKISWENDERNKSTEESDDNKTFQLSMDSEPKNNDISIKNEENNLKFGSYVHVDSHAHQNYVSEMKDDTNYSVQQQNSLLDQENNLLDDDDSSESCCSEVSSMDSYLPPV